ncbi:MAG: hypothetical protein H7Y09_03485 [Chitinophagaceae bacterium]|nr:hypothetical protein [Anaerolineae bacterium]
MVNILKLQRSTTRYEFSDGIRDFHSAFWILLTGLYAWLFWDYPSLWLPLVEPVRSQGTLFVIFVSFILPIGIPLVVSQLGLRYVNEVVRRRWLWRTTGFIKPKSWVMPRRVLFTGYIIILIVFVAGILLAIQLADWWLIVRGIYLGTGLAFVYMHWTLGNQMQILRYQWVARIGLLGTLIIAVMPLRAGLFSLMLSLFWAGLLMVSGLYAMRQVALQQRSSADAA